MRQYWRNLESLARWTRSEPHRVWWQKLFKDSGGTGFWHEAYFMAGRMEAIYDDMPSHVGLARFAATQPARGAMFSTRRRAGRGDTPPPEPVIGENVYYAD